MNIFIPKMYQKDIFSINFLKLKEKGYEVILFDLDNTIGHLAEFICNPKYEKFINELTKSFKVVITSNNKTSRVKKFCSNLNCDYLSWCFKPTSFRIKKIKDKYQTNYDKMIIVGDQILTDIFIGNRLGLMTILVDPIKDIDLKITGFNRKVERIINKKNKLIRGNYYEKK